MNNHNLSERIFTTVLILFPVLKVYVIYGISIDMILMPICVVILLLHDLKFRKHVVVRLGKQEQLLLLPFLVISICAIFASCYEDGSLFKMGGRIVLLLFYSAVLIQARDHIDYALAKRILRYLSVVVVSVLFLQLALYYGAGITMQFLIPGLDTSIEGLNNLYIIDGGIYRPNSIFNEPSHIAYFLSVVLTRELFLEKTISWFWTIMCSSGMILSVSGTGIALVTIIWTLYLLNTRNIKKHGKFLIFLLLIFIIFYRFGLIDQILYSYERASLDNGRINSFFDYYVQLNGIEKIFGIGMGNITKRFAFRSGSLFINGFGRFLIEGGYVSLFTCVIAYFRLLMMKRFPQKAFLVLFVIMNMIESTFFSMYFPFILVWIFCRKEVIVNTGVKKHVIKYSNSYKR